ncbi:hypothetical protein RDI58_028958 [Solanum bulbocastanum]|uniref:Uncharacterized protein n=1 Tax=Solanum bulbocastanum TaxID=147425 RepID=A0AAN8SR11_SOLBU
MGTMDKQRCKTTQFTSHPQASPKQSSSEDAHSKLEVQVNTEIELHSIV